MRASLNRGGGSPASVGAGRRVGADGKYLVRSWVFNYEETLDSKGVPTGEGRVEKKDIPFIVSKNASYSLVATVYETTTTSYVVSLDSSSDSSFSIYSNVFRNNNSFPSYPKPDGFEISIGSGKTLSFSAYYRFSITFGSKYYVPGSYAVVRLYLNETASTVTDNDYVDTANKTITVNNQSQTYSNAYYDNGVYYVYDASGACTTYYTDNSGQIIGDVTYDNSTNVYNINIYNYEGGGGGTDPTPTPTPSTPPTPTPTPSGCNHTYEVTGQTAPTCTQAGSTTYKCSLCGDTYTQTVKAFGHTWTKQEDVPGSGEDSPGYTLYRCSVCSEEYKDYEGTGPPKEEEGGGGIFGWLGDIFGAIFNGVLGILETLIGGAVKLLVSLINQLFEGIKAVLQGLIDSFTELANFGVPFKKFLGEVFPFLPSEIVALLAFSLSLSIILVVIKFFRG